MSSGFKLMLRPPPHVEFLQGYPGIPGNGERKGAMVQGTLEVRGTVKAKWVRVELRKIEILPGGGQNNTFAETIGERPITLWAAGGDEFSELTSNDFPFHIAVPETLPPSIALERGSAIKYELIASVQLKGKKSLFKRDPAPISTFSAPIVIEKFELLQAWPIYAQPQTRQSTAYGVTLIATFARVAFGPGDVVPVEAILRADVPGDGAILRSYELTVRETLIFRASPPQLPQQNGHLHLHTQQPPRRTPAAQTRSNLIADQKVPVPVQIFPGTQHKCDLGCHIPLIQTNVSVRTARHIEVNYIVQVKAVLSTGSSVSVELPITITNWQHQASLDVVRRIGYCAELTGQPPPPAHQVGLFQATNPMGHNIATPTSLPNGHNIAHSNAPSSTAGSNSIPERVSRRSTSDNNHNTVPGRPAYGSPPISSPGREDIDELGYVPAPSQHSHTAPSRRPGGGSSSGPSEAGDYFGQPGPLNSPNPTARPNSNRRSNAQGRLTIVNADEPAGTKPLSAEEEKKLLKEKYAERDRRRSNGRPASAGGSGARPGTANSTNGRPNGTPAWPTAEEEKQKLYDNARLVANKTQQAAGHTADIGASSSSSSPPPQQNQWPTAEEEKRRLYDGARQTAAKTQSSVFEGGVPYLKEDKGGASKNGGDGFAGGWAFMAPKLEGGSGSASYGQEPQTTPSPPPAQPQSQSQWPSAADEKRMLFERARAAAEHTQAQATLPPQETAPNSYPGSSPPPTQTYAEEQQVLSPTSMLSPGNGFAGGFSPALSGLTPAGNKSGAELFAAGLAAMGRQSMYPTPAPTAAPQTTPSPQPSYGSGSGSSAPYGGSSPNPQYGGASSSTPPYAGNSSGSTPYGGASGSAPSYGDNLSHSPSQSKRFPSAADEKAALAYKAAKQRVEQARANEPAYDSSPGPSPTVPGYDSIYGKPATPPPTRPLSIRRSPQAVTASPPAFTNDLPPGFTPNPGPAASALSALEEKARLRRQYEEQDALSTSGSRLSPNAGLPPPASPPPPAFSPPETNSGYGLSAQDEKERMRLMYAEQDAAVRTNERRATNDSGKRAALPALPPAPNGLPPPFAGGFVNPNTMKPLSAAEEKARLRAQYEAEANGSAGAGSSYEPPPPDYGLAPSRQATITSPPARSATLTPNNFLDGGSSMGATIQRDPSISWGKRRATHTPAPPEEQPSSSAFVAPPPPPPLLPKPPASYIKETLEADEAQKDWDSSRPPSMDYAALASPTSAVFTPPVPPKPID